MRKFLPFLMVAACEASPDPPIDGTYRVSFEWVSNDCDETFEDTETMLVDVIAASDETMSLRWRPWDIPGGGRFEGFRAFGNRVDFKTSHTSLLGRGQQADILRGDLSRGRLDLTVTSVDDHPTRHTCIRTYRLHGARRGIDPATADGLFRGTLIYHGNVCENFWERKIDAYPTHVGPGAGGSTIANIGQRMVLAIRPSSDEGPGTEIFFPSLGLTVDAQVSLWEPSTIKFAYEGFLGPECPYAYTLTTLPRDEGLLEGEFLVEAKETDSCHEDVGQIRPRPEIVWTALQPDGSLLLIERGRYVRLPYVGTGYRNTFSDDRGRYHGTYKLDVSDGKISYTLDETIVSVASETCIRRRAASGRIRK